jgi:glycyl-tRNA synthetase beta subunit
MFTRAIFIRPDSELIRESICACAELFVDEEIIQDIYDFIVSRLEMYYQEQAIDKAVVRAVLAKKGSNNVVYDWHLRN